MNIAIIPARGASKRIPRKNIKEFCGAPIIAYAINSAKESNLFDHIVVSTDDEEIARIAQTLGGEVPFLRPKELADDSTATAPVIANVIQSCHKLGWSFTNVCCIYPCVPLIQIQDIREAYNLICNKNTVFSFPVAEYQSPLQRALRLLEDGGVQPLYPQFDSIRTQDIGKSFYDAGQFYWGSAELWLANLNIHRNGLGLVIPNWRAIDINSLEDWYRAELMYKIMINK